MALLLDTVGMLRWLEVPATSSQSLKARLRLTPADLPIAVSLASIWEAAIKKGLGKLNAPDALPDIIAAHPDFTLLAIAPAHAWRTKSLPFFKDHRDPFDRMLIAQALEENLTIATPDPAFQRYGVQTIW